MIIHLFGDNNSFSELATGSGILFIGDSKATNAGHCEYLNNTPDNDVESGGIEIGDIPNR